MTPANADPAPFRGLVLGVGNLLLKDEGVGVHVARAVARAAETPGGALPMGTRVVDGGTLGLDLLPLLDESDAIIIIDAAHLHREPGTVAVLRGEELASVIAGHLSTHQVGIADLLAVARLAGSLPERVSLVAIEPAEIGPGLELTPDVAARLSAAVEIVREEAWAQMRADPHLAVKSGHRAGPAAAR